MYLFWIKYRQLCEGICKSSCIVYTTNVCPGFGKSVLMSYVFNFFIEFKNPISFILESVFWHFKHVQNLSV